MRQGSIVSLVAALVLASCRSPAANAQAAARVGGHAEPERYLAGHEHRPIGTSRATQLRSSRTSGVSAPSCGAIPAGQSVVKEGKIPYLPEALARRDENRAGWPKTDPEAACYLPGIPRATYLPHPFQIVQGDDDILFVYSFANANRAVHMKDHRTIDEVPVDLWMGWSNGSWEGDTLVVEVIANDDRTWFDRAGNYHSSQLKVTERYTPLDQNRIQYEATIEDPETFSAPWTISMHLYGTRSRTPSCSSSSASSSRRTCCTTNFSRSRCPDARAGQRSTLGFGARERIYAS